MNNIPNELEQVEVSVGNKTSKKKKIVYIIFLIIVASIIITCGAYLLFGGSNSNKTENNEKQKNNVGEKGDEAKDDEFDEEEPFDNRELEASLLTDPVVKKLYGYITPDGDEYYDSCYHSGGNDSGWMGFHKYLFTNKSLNASNFNNDEIFFYAWSLIDFGKATVTKTPNQGAQFSKFSIPEDVYDKAIKKLFGPDIIYTKKGERSFSRFTDDEWKWVNINFKYDEAKQAYIGTNDGGGDYCAEEVLLSLHTRLVNATKTSDEIVFEIKFVFASEDSSNDDMYKIYNDRNRKNSIGTEKIDRSNIQSQSINVSKYLDTANTLTVTFKKDSTSGEYHFYSSSTLY